MTKNTTVEKPAMDGKKAKAAAARAKRKAAKGQSPVSNDTELETVIAANFNLIEARLNDRLKDYEPVARHVDKAWLRIDQLEERLDDLEIDFDRVNPPSKNEIVDQQLSLIRRFFGAFMTSFEAAIAHVSDDKTDKTDSKGINEQ